MFNVFLEKKLFYFFILVSFSRFNAMPLNESSVEVVEIAEKKFTSLVSAAKYKSFNIAQDIIFRLGLYGLESFVNKSPFVHEYYIFCCKNSNFLRLQYLFPGIYLIEDILSENFELPKIKIQISTRFFSKEFLSSENIEVEIDPDDSNFYLVTKF